MPTSGCLNSNTISKVHASQGFTLVELLVVLFIVSIMAGLAVVNLPRFAQTGDFDTETERLKVVLEMLREEALIQANEYGLQPGEKNYEFYVYNEISQVWELLQERPFSVRELPADIKLSLSVEGHELQFGEQDTPPILILSSGEITPFELQIESTTDDRLTRTLESDGYGEVIWQGEDDE